VPLPDRQSLPGSPVLRRDSRLKRADRQPYNELVLEVSDLDFAGEGYTMGAIAVTCPECAAVLRPPPEIAPGTNLKCPRCNVVFAMPPDAGNIIAPGRASAPRSERGRPDEHADQGDYGSARRQSSPARRRRYADDYDEDDRRDPRDHDDDYDAPRRRPIRRRRGSNQGLLIGLIIGGSVVALGAVTLMVVLLVRTSSTSTTKDKPIVGAWQPLNQPGFTRAEFTADGKLHVTFSNRPAATGTYRFLDANTIEIEESGPLGNTIKTVATVAINGDDMTVTNKVLRTSVQYKRIR
jgi:hypothetical protein